MMTERDTSRKRGGFALAPRALQDRLADHRVRCLFVSLPLCFTKDPSIVAIHGIGAAPDHTWCKRVSTGDDQGDKSQFVNWLQDDRMLPSIVPNACIMRYGYESSWYGEDALHTKVMDIARTLLRSLRRHRKVGGILQTVIQSLTDCLLGKS